MKWWWVYVISVFTVMLGVGGWIWFMQRPDTQSYTVAVGNASIVVRIADSTLEQKRGLQDVETLPVGHGMLFPFSSPVLPQFWMKDTLIPLDLLWVKDGVVTEMTVGVQPQPGVADEALLLYAPQQEVTAVIELSVGSVHSLGIEVGDRVGSMEVSSEPW